MRVRWKGVWRILVALEARGLWWRVEGIEGDGTYGLLSVRKPSGRWRKPKEEEIAELTP